MKSRLHHHAAAAVVALAAPLSWAQSSHHIVQLHGTGPWGITYINPSEDPRNN